MEEVVSYAIQTVKPVLTHNHLIVIPVKMDFICNQMVPLAAQLVALMKAQLP